MENVSTYFARDDDDHDDDDASNASNVYTRSTSSSIERLRARKRTRTDANASAALVTTALTKMEKQVVAIRAQHRDAILLFECGYRMRFFAEDAETAAAVLGISVSQHRHFHEASVPVHRALHHCQRLVDAGHKVGIVKQVESVAMRSVAAASASSSQDDLVAVAARPLLQRKVVEMFTRATIPPPDTDDLPARFILCVVEATVHRTTLFTKYVHELNSCRAGSDDDLDQRVDDVQIGLLAHDVHTGETIFDEFHDDASRRHLRDALERIEPVELVLPVGRLSAYSEQLLALYAERSADALTQTVAAVRIERVANDAFKSDRARAAFTQFFDAAQHEYAHYAAVRPHLPALCVCCFGGMQRYLEGFRLAKSLASMPHTAHRQRSDSTAAAAAVHSELRLSSASLRDLDIFCSSSTGDVAGSVFALLNQTKTAAGARTLRTWLSAPSTSIAEIEARQSVIEHLVGATRSGDDPSGAALRTSVSAASSSYRLAYEELVESLLPMAAPLARWIQRVHCHRISSVQLVTGLETLVAVERAVEHVVEICDVARAETLRGFAALPPPPTAATRTCGPTLLLQLLQQYPRMRTQATGFVEQLLCRDAALADDMERAVSPALQRSAELAHAYRALCEELALLERQYSAVLATCRTVLQDASLDFATFRYGAAGAKTLRHLVCVKRALLHLVPSSWLVVNSTKTLVRFHPREIHELHLREDYVLQRKQQVVERVWRDVVARIDAALFVRVTQCVERLASIDALCALATVAKTQPGYTLPQLVASSTNGSISSSADVSDMQVLEIVGGRNAIVEAALPSASAYMSASICMVSAGANNKAPAAPTAAASSKDAQGGSLLVVSGPNMGGKSSLLRMCALTIVLAQIGSSVPAESARLSVFDSILTRMHRRSNCNSNSDSPMATELAALSTIARAATRKSFVLIDEIGFGLTTAHASAVASSVVAFLVRDVRCHVVFATHMVPVVARLQDSLRGSCQAKQLGFTLMGGSGSDSGGGSDDDDDMDASDATECQHEQQAPRAAKAAAAHMAFHYTITDGIARESLALHTARLAGIPERVLARAAAALATTTATTVKPSDES